MAEINFGILDTQSPAKIGNAFTRTPEQQNANMLQVMQMKHLIDQSDQAQYAISKARREDAGLAAFGEGLRALGPDPDPDAVAQLFIKHPDRAMQQAGIEMMQKSRAEKGYGALGPMGGAAVSRPATAPASPFTANMMANRAALPAFGDNQLAATLTAPEAQAAPAATPESLIAQIQTRLRAIGPYVQRSPQAKAEADQLTKQLENLSKAQNVAPGGVLLRPGLPDFTAPAATSQEIRTMTALGYPNTQAGYAAFRDAQRPDRLLPPDQEAQKIRIAREGRPPVQPVAPTLKDIVDPNNSNRMISVDVRRYVPGTSSGAGVIGVAGKEPTAALRENKQEAGKTLLADEISNLRNSLNVLNRLEAIPSTGRGVMSNLGSSTQASGVGQFLGKVSGTEAQTERDLITSSKLRLVNAIKQATGMSAQQLNSNVELQTMLKSLSDPSQAIETNIRNLDNIETAYVNSAPRTPGAAGAGVDKSNPLLR